MYDSKFTNDYSTALDELMALRAKVKERETIIETNKSEYLKIIEENSAEHKRFMQ